MFGFVVVDTWLRSSLLDVRFLCAIFVDSTMFRPEVAF